MSFGFGGMLLSRLVGYVVPLLVTGSVLWVAFRYWDPPTELLGMAVVLSVGTVTTIFGTFEVARGVEDWALMQPYTSVTVVAGVVFGAIGWALILVGGLRTVDLYRASDQPLAN